MKAGGPDAEAQRRSLGDFILLLHELAEEGETIYYSTCASPDEFYNTVDGMAYDVVAKDAHKGGVDLRTSRLGR